MMHQQALSAKIQLELDVLGNGLNLYSGFLEDVTKVKHERQRVFLPLLSVTNTHARAVHLLISNDCAPSALALLRAMVETFVRAIWLLYAATDDEFGKFVDEEHLPLRFKPLTIAADKKWPESANICSNPGLLEAMVERRWGPLNSLVHGGMMQVGANAKIDNGKFKVGNVVSDDVLSEAIFIAAFHVFYGGGELLRASDLEDKEQKISELYALLEPILGPPAPDNTV